MRRTTRIVAATLGLALLLSVAGCNGDAVAKVNGTKITREEFDAIVAVAKKQDTTMAALKDDDPQLLQYKRLILDSMVEAELVRQDAKAQGAKIGEAEVTAKLDEIKAGYPDEETFNQTVEQSGMTMEQIRQSISDQLMYEFLYEKVAPASEITSDQVEAYYEANKATQFTTPDQSHLFHILFATDDKATAEKVLKEIQGGGDFEALAKEYSTDPGSKDSGGDLGTAATSNYVEEFRVAADKLKVGELSGLVQSEFGWHIIKKTEEVKGGVQKLDEVAATIKSTLEQESRNKVWQEYLTQLKADAKIEILDKTLEDVDTTAPPSSETTAN
ncbi:MAG: peptidylprolyl isomerase [Coriobacteriia bacterium]